MLRYGLKTKITLNLVVLLALAMLLIDFVVITTAQQVLVESQISKGYLFISMVESFLTQHSDPVEAIRSFNFRMDFKKRLKESGFLCGLIMGATDKPSILEEGNCIPDKKLASLTRQTIGSEKKVAQYLDTTWGVFWKQSRYLILTAPVKYQGKIIAGVGVLFPLETVYKTLRRTQYILFVYIFINTLVLTLVGLLRLSRLTVTPLHRLVKRADEYGEDDEVLFLSEKEDHEFNKLSRSLNSMLKRIAADKKKLKATVASLEKANLDLKQAQNDVIRAEKLASIGRLSSGIAHEIGNPLGIVAGYMELLQKDDISDKDRREYIDRTVSEINRINAIIRQLLDFSRSSSDDSQAVSVHEIVREVIDVVRLQPSLSDIDLQSDLKAESDMVRADANHLRQVFLNLLLNASDAIASLENPAVGRITITSTVEAKTQLKTDLSTKTIKIEFSDNGPGIPKENLGDIFDPFFSTKAPGKGTGLGLSVSYTIIEGFGGTIVADSEEGKGTVIIVHLPLLSGNRQVFNEPMNKKNRT